MGRRQRVWAHKVRGDLMEFLGFECALVDTRCSGALEFDHPNGRAYALTALSQDQRVTRLKKEIAAGQIRLLCSYHNGADGARRRHSRRVGTA